MYKYVTVSKQRVYFLFAWCSWHLPMCTSLCHRVTGIAMAVGVYTVSIGLALGRYDFQTYLDMVKSWNIPKPVLFVLKTLMAFPLVYHCVNGMRHLVSILSWLINFLCVNCCAAVHIQF